MTNTTHFFRVRGGPHHRQAEALEKGWLGDTTELVLRRESDNAFDSNAIKVFVLSSPPNGEEVPIGYVAKQQAAVIAPLLDSGAVVVSCRITRLEKTPEAELVLSVEDADGQTR